MQVKQRTAETNRGFHFMRFDLPIIFLHINHQKALHAPPRFAIRASPPASPLRCKLTAQRCSASLKSCLLLINNNNRKYIKPDGEEELSSGPSSGQAQARHG